MHEAGHGNVYVSRRPPPTVLPQPLEVKRYLQQTSPLPSPRSISPSAQEQETAAAVRRSTGCAEAADPRLDGRGETEVSPLLGLNHVLHPRSNWTGARSECTSTQTHPPCAVMEREGGMEGWRGREGGKGRAPSTAKFAVSQLLCRTPRPLWEGDVPVPHQRYLSLMLRCSSEELYVPCHGDS